MVYLVIGWCGFSTGICLAVFEIFCGFLNLAFFTVEVIFRFKVVYVRYVGRRD